MLYEADTLDTVFYIHRGSCALEDAGSIPLSALLDTSSESCTEIFDIVASITGWCIWRDRWRFVLGGQSSSYQHVIAEIWGEIIHTLRGEWDYLLTLCSREGELRREHFLHTWSARQLFFSMRGGVPRWEYSPPRWLLSLVSIPP